MRPGILALAVVLASLFVSLGCLPAGRASQEDPAPRLEGQRVAGAAPREGAAGEATGGKALPATMPQKDARGESVPWLPRPPGSVRAGYSEEETGRQTLVRASYLTTEKADAVLAFYRGVFAAERWQVANVEYGNGGWHYLVLRGDLEAKVKVLAREGGSEARVELSSPAGGVQESRASAGGSKR